MEAENTATPAETRGILSELPQQPQLDNAEAAGGNVPGDKGRGAATRKAVGQKRRRAGGVEGAAAGGASGAGAATKSKRSKR